MSVTTTMWIDALRAAMAETRFADLPRRIGALETNIAELKREVDALRPEAKKKRGARDVVGAARRADDVEHLKHKEVSLRNQRRELTDARRMLRLGKRPHVPMWEVQFAAEGLAADFAKTVIRAAFEAKP